MGTDEDHNEALKAHFMRIGIAVGMGIGAVFSLLFGIVMKTPGLMGVGIGMGVSIGVAIGEGLYQRKMEP